MDQPQWVKTKTSDLYKAAYLILNGGRILGARKTPLTKKKAFDKGIRFYWKLILEVPGQELIDRWDRGNAQVEATAFSRERRKLKKFLYKERRNGF